MHKEEINYFLPATSSDTYTLLKDFDPVFNFYSVPTCTEVEGFRKTKEVDPKRNQLKSYIDELAALPPNWDGYGAYSISKDAARYVKNCIDLITDDWLSHLNPQDFSPTPNGTITLDWYDKEGNNEITMELNEHGITWAGRVIEGKLQGQSSVQKEEVWKSGSFFLMELANILR